MTTLDAVIVGGVVAVLAAVGIDISLTDALLLTAVIGAGIKVLADQRGWTRSTTLVRQENADLRERNATLEAEVKRLDHADREKTAQIATLEGTLHEIKQRDQASVLESVARHDEGMRELAGTLGAMHSAHEASAEQRRGQQRREHLESMDIWNRILDAVETRTGGGTE